ncbi:ubiquitin family protein [Moniliophthora roreri]|nr:ubiquitin family protein [Moniliophthora roreri]
MSGWEIGNSGANACRASHRAKISMSKGWHWRTIHWERSAFFTDSRHSATSSAQTPRNSMKILVVTSGGGETLSGAAGS